MWKLWNATCQSPGTFHHKEAQIMCAMCQNFPLEVPMCQNFPQEVRLRSVEVARKIPLSSNLMTKFLKGT